MISRGKEILGTDTESGDFTRVRRGEAVAKVRLGSAGMRRSPVKKLGPGGLLAACLAAGSGI